MATQWHRAHRSLAEMNGRGASHHVMSSCLMVAPFSRGSQTLEAVRALLEFELAFFHCHTYIMRGVCFVLTSLVQHQQRPDKSEMEQYKLEV